MGRASKLRLVKSVPKDALSVDEEHLQAFADLVADEAHWKEILAKAETDASRAELERLVGPLLPFRKAWRCHRPDCDSGQPALWQPVFVLQHMDGETSWAPLDIRLCEPCKGEATVEDLLTDAIWVQILAGCADAGLTSKPMRGGTVLQFQRVH